MPIKCFLVTQFSDLWNEDDTPRAGAIWMGDDGERRWPLLATPGGLVDVQECAAPGGWDVSGVIPRITMSPSLQVGLAGEPGSWHGWLRDGELLPV
jgi:hypothetical protein